MLMWCLIITNTTNPGTIPVYWGFYVGDADNKKKRYCLMCNVFKPDRCHHCSVCNLCVLNMDHHCPWLNNCIGFFNRKFFIQMLFYLVLTVIFLMCVNTKPAFEIVHRIFKNNLSIAKELSNDLGFCLLYFIDLCAGIILISFFKFHLKIVLQNKTTIETIDHKGEEYFSEVLNNNLIEISIILVVIQIGFKLWVQISYYGFSLCVCILAYQMEMELTGV